MVRIMGGKGKGGGNKFYIVCIGVEDKRSVRGIFMGKF